MIYKYHVNILDPQSIDETINAIENYKDKILKEKIERFLKELADEGVKIAKYEVSSLDAFFTGELLDSIMSEKGKSTKNTMKYIIKTDSEHAMFVEFGTGIVGKEQSYTGKLPKGYTYASGKTIHYIDDGRYGWFYPIGNGRYRFTEGMRSRPYMLRTARKLTTKVREAAKRAFGGGEVVVT